MKTLNLPITLHKSSNAQSQFIRYFMVGGIAFIADFGALFLLKEWGELNYLLSATLAFIVGIAINYQLSIHWVFDQRAISNNYIEFLIFTFIGILGILLNLGIIFFLTEQLNIFYLHSKLTATAIIFLFNFSTRKIYLFTH
jgi:putative flippase GtrA